MGKGFLRLIRGGKSKPPLSVVPPPAPNRHDLRLEACRKLLFQVRTAKETNTGNIDSRLPYVVVQRAIALKENLLAIEIIADALLADLKI